MNPGNLFIVGTPIGNLHDISERALDTLRSADLVACEDTRVTKKLLERYDIETRPISYHQHSDETRVGEIAKALRDGQHVALVTDAGTPGISDPGNKLIHDLRFEIQDLVVIPIPGPSAVITALSASGFPTDKFLFLGFPPHKKRRNQFFEDVAASEYTIAFYESCHRIKKAISSLKEVLDPGKQVCICRELTKKFETIYRGTISEIEEMDIPEKGEFVVVVRK